ncbi:MAG: serine/threonine protein kinase [Planctomycetia bacterium]|nr:serine/threonine protein kinase [Planctomycetia bacterium]
MPAPHTLIGRVLGGYVVQSQVGAGGMGVVFRGHDERLGRTVAIKVLPARYRDDDILKQRFLREGRTAARIDHPNVVRILSAGEDEGLPYLVMEYVDGGSLQRFLEKRVRFPLKTVLRIARQVAEALAAAHKVGVMHRDVKPANVLFTKEGEAKLVDFGLAREEMSDVSLSQTGMVMGTPHYMAPEICEGKKGDARSDVYALGVVVYAMMALRLPFDAETAVGILMAHIQKPVPPIPEAPRAVWAVLLRALEKNPAKRWASAAEFAAALARVEEAPGEPGQATLPQAVPAASSTPVERSQPAVVPAAPPAIAATPGGLAPSAETPTAGVAVRRKRVPATVIAAGAAALLLCAVAGGLYAAKRRGSADPGPAPVAPGPPATAEEGKPDPVWEAAFRTARSQSRELEAKGEFRRAHELLSALQPPDANASAAVVRELSDLLNRVDLRVQKELASPQRGAEASKRLSALAEKLPEEAAAKVRTLAAEAARQWQARDGYAALRPLFATRDVPGILETLGRAEVPADEEQKATMSAARRAAGRFRSVLQTAHEWLAAHPGTDISFRRPDGTVVAGRIHSIAERGFFLVTGTSQIRVGLGDVCMPDIARCALEGTPSDELLAAAVESVLLAGAPGEAWPFALRARRRRVTLEPLPDRMLREEIPAETRELAGRQLKAIERLRDDAAAAAPLVREWLRAYDVLPLHPRMAADAREAMRVAGGPATPEDIALYSAAETGGNGEDLVLRWTGVESVLADFHDILPARAVPGDLPCIEPAGRSTALVLAGLDWSDVVLEVEVRPDDTFGVVAGWRTPAEFLSVVVNPATPGRLGVRMPVLEDSREIQRPADGWVTLRIVAGGGRVKATVADLTSEAPLPAGWHGALGLFFTGPVSFRRLEARGRARFLQPDLDEEFRPLEVARKRRNRETGMNWKSWSGGRAERAALHVDAGEEWRWLRAGAWPTGANFRVRFRVRAPEGAELCLAMKSGESIRQVLAGSETLNGFTKDGRFLVTGNGLKLPPGEEVTVDVLVRGGLASVDAGQSGWFGHLEGPVRGGVEIGVRRGTVAFGDLRVEELEE